MRYLFVLLLLFGSTMALSINQTIASDGQTYMTATFPNGCANASRPAWAGTFDCSNDTARISGKLAPPVFSVGYGIPDITYKLNIRLPSGWNVPEEWTIKVPGKITDSHGGKVINNNTAVFNRTEIMVESSETNSLPLFLFMGALFIGMALLVGGMVLLIVLKKKSRG